MMEVIDFSKSNSIINQYMSELRDKNTQKNRLLFRHNIKRIGEMMAYELSKTLEYKPKTVTTPLGTIDIPLPKDDMVIATVLRAGLPFHEGFLNVFDKADNGFVSAFRMYMTQCWPLAAVLLQLSSRYCRRANPRRFTSAASLPLQRVSKW